MASIPFEYAPPLMPCNWPVQRCPVSHERASERILIMRTGAHGDLLMASPLLSALRAAKPDAHLTWIVDRGEREAMDANPNVDELILWDSPAWGRALKRGVRRIWLVRAWMLRQKLQGRHYDAYISLQAEEWPLVVRGVKARTSVGVFDVFHQYNHYKSRHRYVPLYSAAFTSRDLPPHRTDQFLLPLRPLGVPTPTEKRMQIGFTQDDADTVAAFLADAGIGESEPLVVLAPMTKWPSRCWAGGNYAQLGDDLARQGYRVALIASAQEREAVMKIAAQMQSRPLLAAGTLRFRQAAALLARAVLLVSGDTGPMHVAAAVGTPFLALFGSTPVLGRAPLAGRGLALAHPVPCGPCDQVQCSNPPETHLLCLRLISVDEAFAAAAVLLGEGKNSRK